MRSLVVLLTFGLGLGAASAATGDALYARDNDVALHAEPRSDAPVTLRVGRSYRLTEVDRQGDWIMVEPYNVEIVGGSAWVQARLVAPEPRDAAPPPPPPPPSDGATDSAEADCHLLLDRDDPLDADGVPALAFGGDCPVVVVVIEDDDRDGFAFFNALPRPTPPSDGRAPMISGGIVPPFSSSPVPSFGSSPVPPLVPSR